MVLSTLMKWFIKNARQPQLISEYLEVLLENRGIKDAQAFFRPVHPESLELAAVGIDQKQLNRALQRLAQAKKQGEKILVYGDYDADGVCSTAVLWETLHAGGWQALPFIPHREKHGYGLSERSVAALMEELKGNLPALIITVDNGIVAHEAITRLQAAGIEVMVSDHHQVETTSTGYPNLPPALAVIHSTQLCGTTVAWFLAREIKRHFNFSLPTDHLDLCAIGTIADQVPLLAANRSFAKHGLQALQNTQRPGLLALLESAAVEPSNVSVSTIHFVLAPRINAMGRLKHGLDALRLLCTTKLERARQLAAQLSATNSERQELTQDMLDLAEAQAANWQNQHLIVVSSSEFHEGVIGLLAGKLVEKYAKPAIVMAVRAELVKGSARSIPGVNIVELIRTVRQELWEVGGHPMAAGFSLDPHKVEAVTKLLWQKAKTEISPELLSPRLELECWLPNQLISTELLKAQSQLAPFGQGNPEPLVAWQDLEVLKVSTMGAVNQHLKLLVAPKQYESDSPYPLTCLAWRQAESLQHIQTKQSISIAGVLEENSWNGQSKLQIVLKDVAVSL